MMNSDQGHKELSKLKCTCFPLFVLVALLAAACRPVTPTPVAGPAATAPSPTSVPVATSTPVTPLPAYATQEAAQQATIVARATVSPFPTAGLATVQTGQPAIATNRRDGLSFQVRLTKDNYLAGEGGQAEVTLRNDGPETVFVRGAGQHLVQLLLLDERGHEPPPWPWSSMLLRSGPLRLHKLAPDQVNTETLTFQVPPVEQAAGHAYLLWAQVRLSRPAPDHPEGPDNLWLRLETGPIPLQIAPPAAPRLLLAELQADRAGWHLRVTDATGQTPPGLLWGALEAASPNGGTARLLRDSPDGTWSAAWDQYLFRDEAQVIVRAWVVAPGYVTAAITQTVLGAGDARRTFGTPKPPMRQTFPSLVAAQAALDFLLYQPDWLPAGVVLDAVQIETTTSEGHRWTDESQTYRLPDGTWLELTQMVTTEHYTSAGWGQARYECEAAPVTVGQTMGYVIQRFGWWVLDWKVGDTGFELRAPVPALSLDELLTIASGVQLPAEAH